MTVRASAGVPLRTPAMGEAPVPVSALAAAVELNEALLWTARHAAARAVSVGAADQDIAHRVRAMKHINREHERILRRLAVHHQQPGEDL